MDDKSLGDFNTVKSDNENTDIDVSLGDIPTQDVSGDPEPDGKKQATPDMDLSIGEIPTMDGSGFAPIGKIDRYKLIKPLGAGGFGTVYLALDTEAGIQVALKALPSEISKIPEELENVRSNFALVSKLLHSNIAGLLHLHKVEEADASAEKLLRIYTGAYLVVMEYVDGSILTNWRKQFDGKKVPFDKAVDICGKVAAALDFAHGSNIIHRDIKSSNIMITSDENVKVLDFGLAAEVRSSMGRVSQRQGDTSGTRPYMAPEQWSGKEQRSATDQYALAAMFYELVNGKVPFHSVFETGDTALMRDVVKNERPDPVAGLSKKQNAVLLRALSKKPEERFASCGDFVTALGGGKISGKRPKVSVTSVKKSGMGKAVAAIVILALLAGGCWFGWDAYQKNEKAKAEAVRLAKLEQEKQQQIRDAVKQAKELYSQNKLTEALRAIQIVFNLDAQNAAAAQLQKEISQKANLSIVSPIRAEAEYAMSGINNISKANGFSIDFKNVNIAFKAANTLFSEKNYKSSLAYYQKVINQCKNMEEQDKARNLAYKIKPEMLAAKSRAEKVNAATDAKALFASGNCMASEADKMIKKREFPKAVELFKSAKNTFAKAEFFAKDYQVVVPLKQRYEKLLQSVPLQDLNRYGGTDWNKAHLAANEAENAFKREDWNRAIESYKKTLNYLPEAVRIAEGCRKAEAARMAEKRRKAEAARMAEKHRKAEVARMAKIIRMREPYTIPGLNLQMVYVPPGSFCMGSNYGDSDEKPVHRVTITKGYWIGKYEVTQDEYRKIMGSNPSYYRSSRKPVEKISWNDAVTFCKKLTARERAAGRLPLGYEYRLPTEAEWEFVARGGNNSHGYIYSGANSIDSVAWYKENAIKGGWISKPKGSTYRVGTKQENELGIYDMSGNVWEWCLDNCGSSWGGCVTNTYKDNVVDPVCRIGANHIIRGGGWSSDAKKCRVTSRAGYSPTTTYTDIGFRIAMVTVH